MCALSQRPDVLDLIFETATVPVGKEEICDLRIEKVPS